MKLRKIRRIGPATALGLLLACAMPSRAWAQDGFTALSLDQLLDLDVEKVFSASRFVQDSRRAPSSVTVITSADIRRFGYRTLADALRSVVGFYTTYDRNYTYVGVRGFGRPGDYNSRLLVMVDGHRLNDGVYDQALIGTEFPIDVDLIDRIEVIRGPSSSLYGNSAFFAVVNVLTRRGHDVAGAEVQIDGGSAGTVKGRAAVGARLNSGFEYLLSGSAYGSDGERHLYFPEFDTPATHNGIADNLDADRSRSFFGRAGYHGFSVEGGWSTRHKNVPTASFSTVFDDPRFETTDDRGFASLQYGHAITERTEVVGRAFADWMRYHGNYPMTQEDRSILVQDDWAAWNGVGAEIIATHRFQGRNSIAVGMEGRRNIRLDQGSGFPGVPESQWLSTWSDSTWALFAQQEFAAFREVLLNLGYRYDHDGGFGGSLNPRLGLILMPTRPGTIKVLYGTAFRAPTAYELQYWTNQPPLDPEKIRTTEVVWEQRFAPHLRTSASIFYNVIDQLISETVSPATGQIVFANTDRVTAKGVEWFVDGTWARGIMTRFGHTWESAENAGTAATLSNAPRHVAKIAVLAPTGFRGSTVGMEGEYVGRRFTIHDEPVPGFYRQNLTFNLPHLVQRLDARLSIGNLFNRKYGDPGAEEHVQTVIVQDGRRAVLTFGYHF